MRVAGKPDPRKQRRLVAAASTMAQRAEEAWQDIDATPRVDAQRLSVKHPKAPAFVNHAARYRRLRRANA